MDLEEIWNYGLALRGRRTVNNTSKTPSLVPHSHNVVPAVASFHCFALSIMRLSGRLLACLVYLGECWKEEFGDGDGINMIDRRKEKNGRPAVYVSSS